MLNFLIFIFLSSFLCAYSWAAEEQGDKACDSSFTMAVGHAAEPGFISLYSIPEGARAAQEAEGNSALVALKPSDLAKQGLELFWLLNEFTNSAKPEVLRGNWSPAVIESFQSLNSLSREDFDRFTSSQKLLILKAYTEWHILMPEPTRLAFEASLSANFETWNEKRFFSFGKLRRDNPQVWSQNFIGAYHEQLIGSFSELKVEVQLEVLGAELLQGQFIEAADLGGLFEQLESKLRAKRSKISSQSIAQFYRSLNRFRASQPGVFSAYVNSLIYLLELQINRSGMSLNDGGRVASKGQFTPRRHQDFDEYLRKLSHLLNAGNSTRLEYEESTRLGFYDPVDVYIPTHDLVIENHSRLVYFRQFDSTGEYLTDDLFIRPFDAAKKICLISQGISVLSRNHANKHLPIGDMFELISIVQAQNPEIWSGVRLQP